MIRRGAPEGGPPPAPATARRLLGRLAPHRGPVVAVVALTVAGIVLSVIGPRVLGHATDLLFDGVIGRGLPAGTSKEQAVAAARAAGDTNFADMLARMNVTPGRGIDFAAVGRTLAVALGLYLLAALFIWTQARLLNNIVQRTVLALRTEVEDKIHRLPLSYFDSRQRGEVLSRVTNDVDNVATSLSMTVSQLLTAALTVVAVLAMMLSISVTLTLVTLAGVPLSLWATRVIARRSQRLFAAQWADTGRLNAHVEETYSGFAVVKTYGHRDGAQRRFGDLNAAVYRSGFGAQFLSGLVAPATVVVGNLGFVAVAVLGGFQVATGRITLGGVQAFIQYVRQFNQPLTQIAGFYNSLQSGIASAARVFELLDETGEPAAPAAELPPGPGRVRFENVSFGYRAGAPVIRDLNLTVAPGTTVAIVGPTGAGKTTLVNLLMRFYDVDTGRILVDGVDVRTVTRESLRSRIGMVLQDTWLMGGTIAENIAYGRPGAGLDEIVAAARAARVDDFVRGLSAGYQSVVGDDGAAISVGEKQLITIARAFLADPQILILDEATSSVDTRTERLVRQAMTELRRDRTCVVIAHRIATVRDADMIVVVDDGRIVEQGTHAELLARRGPYRAMVEA